MIVQKSIGKGPPLIGACHIYRPAGTQCPLGWDIEISKTVGLNNIASGVDLHECKGDPAILRLFEGHQAVTNLLITGLEVLAQRVNVVLAGHRGFEECIVGHEETCRQVLFEVVNDRRLQDW